MASGYEAEVTLCSARDLKNCNWRYGALLPYVSIHVDPAKWITTYGDEYGGVSPTWNQTRVVPLHDPIEHSTLTVDILHYNEAIDVQWTVGSARVPLKEVLDAVGIGGRSDLTLDLTRPSGRPQGKVKIKVVIRQQRYYIPDPYDPAFPPPAPAPIKQYCAPPPQASARPHYRTTVAPPARYGAHEPPRQSTYAPAPSHVPAPSPPQTDDGVGAGTEFAVGAVAGMLGGLAIAEGLHDYYYDDE